MHTARIIKILTAFILYSFFSQPVMADGSLDTSFNVIELTERTNIAGRVALDSTGRIIATGRFVEVDGHKTENIIRINANGFIDTTFSAKLQFDNPTSFSPASALVIQSDNKIIVGGAFTGVNDQPMRGLVRFNVDGTIDATFNPSIALGLINEVKLQSDGKILVSGSYTVGTDTTTRRLSRFNTDGSLDNGYNLVSINSNVAAIGLLSNGQIIIGGSFTNAGGETHNRIAKLNANGSVDSTFTAEANGFVSSIVIDSNDNIIIGGGFGSVNTVVRERLAKMDSAGTLDSDYNPAPSSIVRSLAINSTDQLAVGGDFQNIGGIASARFAVLSSTGVADADYNESVTSSVSGVAWQSTGEVLFTGNLTLSATARQDIVTRLTDAGTVDSTLSLAGYQLSRQIFDTAIDKQDRVLIAGGMKGGNQQSRHGLIRVNDDGSLDDSFVNSVVDGSVNDVRILQSGKILICGSFKLDGEVNNKGVARLNPDGSIDTSFNTAVTVVFDCEIINNKIIIGGSFFSVNGDNTTRFFARLNDDGSTDNSFTATVDNSVFDLYVQPDGKLLLGGAFATVNGESHTRLARLNNDIAGSLDNTFNTAISIDNTVSTIATQRDGKILIGGRFSNVNGEVRGRFARLNADGSLDPLNRDFEALFSTIDKILVQPDDAILVGGNFTQLDGNNLDPEKRYLLRLTPSGELDTDFNPTINQSVRSLTLAKTGKLIAVGNFTEASNAQKISIARFETGLPDLTQEICVPIKTTTNNVAVICL